MAALAAVMAVVALVGCSGRETQASSVWPLAQEMVPPVAVGVPGGVEVLTFGSFSRYMDESVPVRRGGQLVEFVEAEDFKRWWDEHIAGPFYLPGETAGPGPWAVRGRHSPDRTGITDPRVVLYGPLSQHHVTTGADGRGVLELPAGDYVACAHFTDDWLWAWAVAGCEPVTLAPGTVVYAYFAQGSAFIDTGEGTAHDAYLSFVCRHRAGQQAQDLSAEGCPAPPL